MKKFLALAAIIAFIAAVVLPVAVQAAGNFSDWQCSQCGLKRHMAGQPQPPDNGCKVNSNIKHIWFKI